MSRKTIDSNITGAAYALESDLGILSANPTWKGLEPNTYSDFGGKLTLTARNPINPSRQQKKGSITDLEASGGFNTDLTFSNMTDLMQGFMFADMREKASTNPVNSTENTLKSSASGVITCSATTGFQAGDILILANASNILQKDLTVTAVADNTVTVSPALGDGDLYSDQYLKKVGVTVAGVTTLSTDGSAQLTASDSYDFANLGLIAGEWVYLKGAGFARASAWSGTTLTFDKVTEDFKDAANVSAVYLGDIIKNEETPDLIKLRTYHVERQLGKDANGTMSEYLKGAAPNQLVLNASSAGKVTCDLTFVALDHEMRSGADGIIAGTRVAAPSEDCYNTTSDFSRIKIALTDDVGSNPKPLFAFSTDMKLTINNNVSTNKAIGTLGGFDVTAGMFAVTATNTAYFSDTASIAAVRNNSNATMDFILKKSHNALIFDIPLISLGDGRLSVTADKAITLNLDVTGVENKYGTTLLFQSFPYLP